jgi:hypothetical protein
MMRTTRFLLAACCAGALSLLLAGAVLGDHSVPWKAKADGQITNSVPPTADSPGRMDFVAVGTSTHLGLYTEVGGADILADGTVANGTYTKTAADGSTISGTYSGTFQFLSPTEIEFDVTTPVTGGTGRFAGVTGTGQLVAVLDLATGLFHYKKTGTLTLK